MNVRRSLIVAATALPLARATASPASSLGLVLMHGGGDRPPTQVMRLAWYLGSQNIRVATPIMPWSAVRDFDADYPAALREIDTEIKRLRDAGATHVAVGGQSMGANAALAYAGSGRTVDAVVAIAPGHIADLWREHPLISASVRKARDMIAEGRGDARANFDYIDQGTRLSVRTSAAIFLSYWDPDGLGAMPRSAAAIATPTPLLWVVGGADRISSLGPGYAFERAPPHSRSRYVEVAGGRYDTPDVAREEIGRWCSELLA